MWPIRPQAHGSGITINWNNYLAFVESVQQQVQLPVILWQLANGTHQYNGNEKRPTKSPPIHRCQMKPIAAVFEDSSATFWFGDVFSSGGADRLAYFATNRWGEYDSDRAEDVTVTDGQICWTPAIERLPDLNIAALLSGPGVGRGASTFACAVDTAASTDDLWWINQAQRYYLSLSGLGWLAISTGICADFDGDGKADPAVYVPTYAGYSAGWYVWMSGNGYQRQGPHTLTAP